MNLSKGVLSLLTVALILLLLGAGVVWRILERREGAAAADAGLPSTEGVEVSASSLFATAQAVQGVPVVQDTLWQHVVADGQAEANRQTVVRTRRSGVVQRVLVGESDLVRAGQVLLQLDTVEAALDLAQARAELASRENQFQVRMLQGGTTGDPGVLAERERNLRLEVGLTAAENAVQRAELSMEQTRVTAPFAGHVANLRAVEGQHLGSGEEVLTLAQLDPIRVLVEVLEADLANLGEGRLATVRFTAFRDETFEAVVASVNPIVDDQTRSGRVTLVLPNPNARILPGMHANARINARAFADRIQVPRESVLERLSGAERRPMVFMASELTPQGNGMAEWRYVTLGERNETHQEILPTEGIPMLQAGEIVLVDGHQYLAHDTPIRLVENVELAGGRPGR